MLPVINKFLIITFWGKVCMSGYFGRNCSLQCPYPTFGKRCQGKCDCEQDLCDVSTGCKIQSTGIGVILQLISYIHSGIFFFKFSI